jgi:hypothetical protein
VVAAAVVSGTIAAWPSGQSGARFRLDSLSGRPIGNVVVRPADAGNDSLTLVAWDLPSDDGEPYLLWAAVPGAQVTTVGRFMVNMSGSCKVEFNIPGGRSWAHFWVTRPGRPRSVIATTPPQVKVTAAPVQR